jgi:hypothetical protein
VSPAQAVIGFVAYFATHLRDIHFAITTLIFSQILRDHLHLDRIHPVKTV